MSSLAISTAMDWPARIQLAGNRGFKLLVFDRPDQIILGAQPNCFIFSPGIVGMTNQNNRQVGTKPSQPTQDVQAVCISPGQIQQKQIGSRTPLDRFQRFPATTHGFQLPGIRFSNRPERTGHAGIFTDSQHACGFD